MCGAVANCCEEFAELPTDASSSNPPAHASFRPCLPTHDCVRGRSSSLHPLLLLLLLLLLLPLHLRRRRRPNLAPRVWTAPMTRTQSRTWCLMIASSSSSALCVRVTRTGMSSADLRTQLLANLLSSMEAHLQLASAHLPTISFGTGSLVRLPGPTITQPNVYHFNSTTYRAIHD